MTEKQNLDEWNDFLREKFGMPSNYKLVNSSNNPNNNVWKLIAVILCIVFLLEIAFGVVYFGFIIEDGKLKGLFSTNTNITNNIDTPDLNVTNNYLHNIYNNITINIINEVVNQS